MCRLSLFSPLGTLGSDTAHLHESRDTALPYLPPPMLFSPPGLWQSWLVSPPCRLTGRRPKDEVGLLSAFASASTSLGPASLWGCAINGVLSPPRSVVVCKQAVGRLLSSHPPRRVCHFNTVKCQCMFSASCRLLRTNYCLF